MSRLGEGGRGGATAGGCGVGIKKERKRGAGKGRGVGKRVRSVGGHLRKKGGSEG